MPETLTTPPPAAPPVPAAPAAPVPTSLQQANAALTAMIAEADGTPTPKQNRDKPRTTEKVQEQPTKPVSEPAPKPEKTETPPKPDTAKPEEAPKPDKTAPLEDLSKVEPKGLGQIVNRQRKQIREMEVQLADLRTKESKLSEMDGVNKRLEAAEKRKAELEDHMRFVDFSKSEEFVTKYQKPFEEAYAKAVHDTEQLAVFVDETGATRKATAQDFLALANMPLSKIDETAEAWFGKSAARVIRHIEKVRDLSEAQTQALEEAKKTGAERATRQAEATKSARDEVATLWKQFNEEDATKEKFLQPIDDDEEWNGKLTQATSYVDKAFASHAADPKLTPEQRSEAVRRMTVVRNRAIGFSSMKLRAERAEKATAALQKELDAIKSSGPVGGNGRPPAEPVLSGDVRQRALDDLNRKLAE